MEDFNYFISDIKRKQQTSQGLYYQHWEIIQSKMNPTSLTMTLDDYSLFHIQKHMLYYIWKMFTYVKHTFYC